MLIKKVFSLYLIILTVIYFPSVIKAQNNGGSTYWIDPNRGEKIYRKTGIIQANQVQSIFGNWGIFGKLLDPYSGVWPKGTFHGHIHEMTMLAASEVVGRDGKKYHVISESYAENPNRAPDGHEYWWNPLPGYANEHRHFVSPDGTVDTTTQVAHSADTTTWPASWPGKDATWDGTWNGYFGQNQFNADDEAYYVMDDYWNDKYPYYPFPDDSTKRGLGLQCETRIFEWAHPLAQDQVFIHFRVTNTSPTDYRRDTRPIFFGAYADVHPGGLGSTNDVDSYDINESMVITYAYQNKGIWSQYPNILPGYMAWKFLESPGISDDGIDNDHDGLVDERRDNDAGQYIFGPVGIYGPPKWHWSGDENGNWNPDFDDVGSDGIGPFDPNYKGPDADGTEGNGRPDQGEPDFGFLDKDESDQIGLTSFAAPSYGSVVARNEDQIWAQIQPGIFSNPIADANLLWIFASGPFDLDSKQTERFSTVWIFGPDNETIYRNAITSQNIYNNNYRFTKPPLQPIVHAVPGDHKVTIYWDNRAEKSVNPVYGQNFEGYMVVRGTDPQLTEAKVITDGQGDWTYYKPLAQFDLIDGIKGMSPIASGSELGDQYSKGIQFYLGNDSGLKYSFEDDNVINGVTYYYAVLAYDRGYFPGMDTILINRGFLKGTDRHLVSMEPSYSPFSFTYDTYNQLVSQSPNTAIVTPNPPATNYVSGHTDADENGYITYSAGPNQTTTGKVQIQVIDPSVIPNANNYEVSFADSLNNVGEDFTYGYTVKDLTTGKTIFNNLVIPIDSTLKPGLNWSSTIFDGMLLNFQNVQPNMPYILAHSGWTVNRPENLQVNILKGTGWNPENFTLEVTDQPGSYQFKKTDPVYFKIYSNTTGDTVPFWLTKDVNSNNSSLKGHLDIGDEITILAKTNSNRYQFSYKLQFTAPADTTLTPRIPQSGDKYVFVTNSPFGTNDKFQFNTTASQTKQVRSNVLDEVSVVPNPYIVAAKWEQPTALQGRGEQKIYFNHLPAQCTIRIFTQNGYLIKTIQHSGNVANGSEAWDLTTKDGLDVAFGIYVYHIDAPGIGQKIGTFAVIQ
ncbi:MAG: hypothetical protein M1480_04100 [Bacteroidetes bacterium]|nr:hypothetical protein [Bacteroidota bacterium]